MSGRRRFSELTSDFTPERRGLASEDTPEAQRSAYPGRTGHHPWYATVHAVAAVFVRNAQIRICRERTATAQLSSAISSISTPPPSRSSRVSRQPHISAMPIRGLPGPTKTDTVRHRPTINTLAA